MASSGPFRADPQWRCCPRCDEVLEETFPGGSACPRCGGAWIIEPVIEGVFGDPTWPGRVAMWWRRELDCPECGSLGRKHQMDAIEAHGVIVDRCRGHGVWFDAGELQRVTETTGDPMGMLRERVAQSRPQIDAARLAYEQRRDQARLTREAQREEAERVAELAALQEQEQRKARAASEAFDRLAEQRHQQHEEIAEAIASKEAKHRAMCEALAHQEAELAAAIAKLQPALAAAREAIARHEEELARLRVRLRSL